MTCLPSCGWIRFCASRYQFWFFLYPTGSPFFDSARLLRQKLQEVVADCGAEAAAVNHMVLVGHSMGGLISKLQVTDSEDKMWSLVSRLPIDQIKADESTREVLRQTFFFSPQPAIKQVVFIGTPHRGSELSQAPIGRLGSILVHSPRQVVLIHAQRLRTHPGVSEPSCAKAIPTSVDLLAADNRVLETMIELPFERPLKLHSVVGTSNENVIGHNVLARFLTGGVKQPGDGVVPISSAHLYVAESECLVPATHEKVHRHPLTFAEVRRILREHLQSVPDNGQIQELGGASPAKPLILHAARPSPPATLSCV